MAPPHVKAIHEPTVVATMSQDEDKLIEKKVNERLKAIEREKSAANIYLRCILAVVGAATGYWLFSKTGPLGEGLYWVLGVGAVLGFFYELLQLALVVGFLIMLVKCVA
jgi:hypothetical protein